MQEQIKITQIRSSIRTKVKQKRTLEALGLRGMYKSVVLKRNSSLEGMLVNVSHLIKIEEVK